MISTSTWNQWRESAQEISFFYKLIAHAVPVTGAMTETRIGSEEGKLICQSQARYMVRVKKQ